MPKWIGTPVPNSGLVENVYINTNLSVVEVVEILKSVDLIDVYGSLGYIILVNGNGDSTIQIVKVSETNFAINVILNGGETSFIAFSNEGIEGVTGWGEFENPIVFNQIAISEMEGISFGTQNDKLSSLFSITPFEEEQKPTPIEPEPLQPIKYPYHYAKYTIQFRDVLELYPTLLDELQFTNEDDTTKFIKMLKNKWFIYEIGGETIEEFKTYLTTTFNEYIEYYEEMLNAYKTEINMLDGIKTSITYDETKQQDTSLDNSGTSEDKTFGLPNKTTSTDYLTERGTINNTARETFSDTTTKNHSIQRTGGVNVIELKREYMNLIRNLYSEFADKFQKCFITLY